MPARSAPVPESELTLRTVVSSLDGGHYEILATLTNDTDAPIRASWTAPCPGPGLRFDGLPIGYDYGATCSAGACAIGPTETRTLTIPAGRTAVAGQFTVVPAGDACNRPLDLGRYQVGATLEVEGVRIRRAGLAEIVVSSPPARPEVVREPRPATPRSPTRSPPEPHERCPEMGCAYTPCPPGVEPPTGCAAVCGCSGRQSNPLGPR